MTKLSQFAPFETISGAHDRGMLIIADHAKRLMPDEYAALDLPPSEFERHIAYDIGVEMVTRRLAELTKAPAVMAGFSRLLIDPNRGEEDPTLIRQLYDGTVIPGNYPMTDAERERRLDLFYRPYHDAVGSTMAAVAEQSGTSPFIVSMHSFTPTMKGRIRPWHIGILWDSDDRAVRPLFELLAADPALVIGDNEPYDGALRGDTMFRHAIVNGFAHILIEIRQDLIATEAGANAWAERLAPMLDAINNQPDIHIARQYGSRTGPIIARPEAA